MLVLTLIKYVLKIDFYVGDFELFAILFFYILCGVGLGVLIASAVEKSGRANAIFRITSYNVCYTKLLRAGPETTFKCARTKR